jgi:hypothetical protein
VNSTKYVHAPPLTVDFTGLTLSIMVLADHLGPAEGVRARLDHLSVHDGKLIQTTHLRGALSGLTESMLAHIINGDRWWSLEWRTGETKWPGKRVSKGPDMLQVGS